MSFDLFQRFGAFLEGFGAFKAAPAVAAGYYDETVIANIAEGSIVAYWENESDGTDRVGTHDATPSGNVVYDVASGEPKRPLTARIDGGSINDPLVVPHHPDLDFDFRTEVASMFFWFKTGVTGASGAMGKFASGGGYRMEYRPDVSPDQHQFKVNDGGSTGVATKAVDTSGDGNWHLWTCVVAGAGAGQIRSHVDKLTPGTATVPGFGSTTNTVDLLLADAQTFFAMANGTFYNHICVTNEVLTQTQIDALYDGGVT